MQSFCSTCLSSDRSLVLLEELEWIKRIVGTLNLDLNLHEDGICWECKAIFKKIVTFTDQILRAQKTIRKKHTKRLKPLSKLSIVKKDSYDEFFSMEGSEKQNVLEDSSGEEKFEMEFVEDWDEFDDEEAKVDQSQEEVEQINEDSDVQFVESKEESSDAADLDHAEDESTVAYEAKPYMKLSSIEEQFLVKRMSLDEVYRARDSDRNTAFYKRCPYKCARCVIGYYSEEQRARHVADKHAAESNSKKKLRRCTICDTGFTRQDALETHYEKHFRLYQCKSCDYQHHKLANMLAHKLEHEPPRVHKCPLCPEVFHNMRSFRYHQLQHKERPTCDICGKSASTKHNLKAHMLIHTGAAKTQCDECGRWVRASSMRAHRRTHGGPDEAAYCVECGAQFASKELYRRHLAASGAHARNAPRFECSQCDASYTDKYTLARHVSAIHDRVYRYKCHICDKGFVRKDRLQNHIMERHEGVSRPRDQLCTYCGKGFKESKTLKRHIYTHTGERPYPCEYCDASFAQTGTRNAHMRAIHAHEWTKSSSGRCKRKPDL